MKAKILTWRIEELLIAATSLLMKGLKLWLWGVKQAKADTGLRSSSSVELVAHLGRMLRAHLGWMPTCRVQGWKQPQHRMSNPWGRDSFCSLKRARLPCVKSSPAQMC